MTSVLSAAEFGRVRAFVAVAETRSFTRAARALGVSPSALSQTIRSLEESIGSQLLNRTTRSVSLTEAGDRLLSRASAASEELTAAVREAANLQQEVVGVVRIHSFQIAATLFLRPLLRSFNEAYPKVILDVTLDDRVIDFVRENFDAAIRLRQVIDKDLIAVKLGPELSQIAVASPAYLKRSGIPETPGDLKSHQCLNWRWPGQSVPCRWEFRHRNGRWIQVAVSGPVIANSREFCINAAIDGLGIAFSIKEAVASHIAAGRLVALLEKWSAPYPGFFLCYPPQRQMPGALRAFINHVTASRSKS